MFNSFAGLYSKLAPERHLILDINEARDDGVTVTSAGLHANYLHSAADKQRCQHLITQSLKAG